MGNVLSKGSDSIVKKPLWLPFTSWVEMEIFT